MTLAVQTVRQLYNGNGATTTFAIPFAFAANDEVRVKTVVTSTGVETLKTITTDYTISGTNVVFNSAPATGTSVLVIMHKDMEQQTADFSDQTPFLPTTIESSEDYIVSLIQQLEERINRCITLPETSSQTLVEFPRSLSGYSGYVPSVKSSEDKFEFVVTVDTINGAVAAAAAASSSASSASSSASAAASSASAAASSASAAASSLAAMGTEIQETLSGSVNGLNTTFTLTQTPTSAGSFKLYRSGILLIVGTHYTRSGTTVTMLTAPSSPQVIHANYRY